VHYEPEKNNHGLRHTPFPALVVPRPIGWISTITPEGVVNLAPYSFYNALSSRPPIVMFASSSPKDSRRNAELSGEFVVNIATFDLRHEMGGTSEPLPPHISEPEAISLAMAPSRHVKPPRVAASPAALECRYMKTVELHDRHGTLLPAAAIIGEVVGIYIDDALIVDGLVDIVRAKPIARLGYKDYCVVKETFPLRYPK